MNIVLFGASGMVGAGVLIECLADSRVRSVLVIGRTATGQSHPKLREVIHNDFFSYDAFRADFASSTACFFCLGVTSLGLDEPSYSHVTYDLTLAAARAMVSANANLTFCYVSGVGTDSTERGRIMWARVKGKTENALLALPFKAAFVFRPGYIQPMKGIRSKTGWYQASYNIAAPFYPILHRLLPGSTTTTVNVGRAMIQVAVSGYSQPILYSRDINALAGEV